MIERKTSELLTMGEVAFVILASGSLCEHCEFLFSGWSSLGEDNAEAQLDGAKKRLHREFEKWYQNACGGPPPAKKR